MSISRTRLQAEANELDERLFRLARNVERFSAEWLHGSEGIDVYNDALKIEQVRSGIRKHMHPQDREDTK